MKAKQLIDRGLSGGGYAASPLRGRQAAAAPVARLMPIDIERLLQWAFAPGRQGGMTWREDPELSLNRGLTVIPRRPRRVTWAMAAACAGISARTPRLRVGAAIADPDAAIVAEAVHRLPSGLGAVVRHYARSRTRPVWIDQVEVLVPDWKAPGEPRIGYVGKRNRTGPFCRLRIVVVEQVTPKSQARYTAWHGAVASLIGILAGSLSRWEIQGFAAPAAPWLEQGY